MSNERWALILGASSGFGAATAKTLAGAGYHIFGVHLDRRATMNLVDEVRGAIESAGRRAMFFNINASSEEKRKETIAAIKKTLAADPPDPPIKVLLHSLAFGSLKPFIGSPDEVMVKVVATGYSSTPIETDDTPFITAANTPTRDGILALSRDLLSEYTRGAPFSFGDRVHVSDLGEFIVEDTMNKRWRNRIDIWFPSRGQAFQFGVREAYLSTTLTDYDSFAQEDASDFAAPKNGF